MNQILNLEEKINQARKDYYNGESKVSDALFDSWIDELSTLDAKNLAIIGIGSESISNWEKYNHKVEMGSLNKCQNHQEFLDWHKKYASKNEMLATLKLDGLSVSLIYENGLLTKAVTRGSGITGELITANVARMNYVPLKLRNNINATIRGEILLSKENHKKYFPDYSNPRNAASGLSRKFNSEVCDKLDVLVYQIISDDIEEETYSEQFEILKSLGKDTDFCIPYIYLFTTEKEILDLKNDFQNSLRERYPYDLDGLVIHNNSLEKQREFGSHNARPYASIAYKFESVGKETTIREIQIQVGNSGRITPVANFDTIDLGTNVSRSTLHNFSNLEDLGIDVGCKILVCRSGDVIPFIEEVTQSTGTIFKRPTNCPECNSTLENQGEYLTCVNTDSCPAQLSGRIKNWVKELNILELGETLIDKLTESKLVNDVSDLYKLTIKDLASLERMAEKSAKNVHDSLWSCNEVMLEILLGALSIPMAGKSTFKLLIESGNDSLEKMFNLNLEMVKDIKGIGPIKAKSIINGLNRNKDLINKLLANGVKIKEKLIGNLTGKSICITGSTNNKRAALEKMIIDNGGVYKSSISKTCTHLIIADVNSTTSKAIGARKLGIKLISEEEFLNLIK